MKKILLIDTNTTPFNEAFPVYPVGLDYLQGALWKKYQYKADILDLTRLGGPLSSPDLSIRKKKSLELIKEKVAKEHWDIIGLSLRNIDSTYPVGSGNPDLHYYLPDLLDYILCTANSVDKDAYIVLGGTAFSMMPDVIMEGQNDNCFGIIGPAESTFPSLVNSLLNGIPVPRITRSEVNGIGILNNRELIYQYLKLPVGDSTFGIRTSTGCGRFCGYCPYPLVSGHKQFFKKPEKVLGEIKMLKDLHKKSGSRQPMRFMFVDDIFNANLDHSKEIISRMMENDLVPDSWHAYLDPKNMDEEFFEMIFRTNGWCQGMEKPTNYVRAQRHFNLLFDIENGSAEMLKRIGKPFTIKDIITSVNTYKRVAQEFLRKPDITSIGFGFHILLGYPGENEITVRETSELINDLAPSQIVVQTGVRIYPNTPLASETRGILWHTDDDLIKPMFSDMDTDQVISWFRKYLHKRYINFRPSGSMILISE